MGKLQEHRLRLQCQFWHVPRPWPSSAQAVLPLYIRYKDGSHAFATRLIVLVTVDPQPGNKPELGIATKAHALFAGYGDGLTEAGRLYVAFDLDNGVFKLLDDFACAVPPDFVPARHAHEQFGFLDAGRSVIVEILCNKTSYNHGCQVESHRMHQKIGLNLGCLAFFSMHRTMG